MMLQRCQPDHARMNPQALECSYQGIVAIAACKDTTILRLRKHLIHPGVALAEDCPSRNTPERKDYIMDRLVVPVEE